MSDLLERGNVEVELTPVDDVEVPDEVDDFYLKLWLIRDTGATNMMNPVGVADVARQLGYDNFVDWLEPDRGTRHNEDYGKLLTSKVHGVIRFENGKVRVEEASWVDAFPDAI